LFCVTERRVFDTVHSDARSRWHTALLHGVGSGTVQQKGRHYVLGSLVSTVSRYVTYSEMEYFKGATSQHALIFLADARLPRTAPASRRRRVLPSPCHPRLGCNGIVCCCMQRTAHWHIPYYALSMGMSQQCFVFLSLVILTFDV